MGDALGGSLEREFSFFIEDGRRELHMSMSESLAIDMG